MGGAAGIEEYCAPATALIALMAILVYIRLFLALQSSRDCETLRERRRLYRRAALYSFLSAPLVCLLCISSGQLLFEGTGQGFITLTALGVALLGASVLHGLINLSRARDVRG